MDFRFSFRKFLMDFRFSFRKFPMDFRFFFRKFQWVSGFSLGNFNGFPVFLSEISMDFQFFLRNFSYFKNHFTYRNCLVTRVSLAIFKSVNPTKQKLSSLHYQPLTKWDDPTSKIGVGHDLAIIFRGTIEINFGWLNGW